MPSYKLTYFNGKGRGEVPRWLFVKAGVEYEDNRVEGKSWLSMKESTPFRQLPILEVDGVVISQSLAISRFLATRFGFNGKNDVEAALIDSVLGSMEDAFQPMQGLFSEKDEARKEELRKKFEEEQLPKSLGYLEEMLTKNNGGDSYFVGDSMTLADMHVAFCLTFPQMMKVDPKLQNFPKLQALQTRVESDAKIAEWIKTRPETPF